MSHLHDFVEVTGPQKFWHL